MAVNRSLNDITVTTLKGVGDALAEKLAKIGIHTIQDLLFHLPLRYQDRTRLTPIGTLQPTPMLSFRAKCWRQTLSWGDGEACSAA